MPKISFNNIPAIANSLEVTITGSTSSETLSGTSSDDVFDGKGGNDIINGGAGNDTALFFADSSNFTITSLTGVTKIKGYSSAGDYQYYTVTLTNVESAQFADRTIALTTSDDVITQGTTGSNTLTGTAADDIFEGGGGNDTINGGLGNDTALFFADSSNFTITTWQGVTKVKGNGDAGGYAYDTASLSNIEYAQFTDKTIKLDLSTAPPDLLAFSLSPTVDVASGTGILQVSASTSEDESGIDDVVVWFNQNITYSSNPSSEVLSGTRGFIGLWGHYDKWDDYSASQYFGLFSSSSANGVYQVEKVVVKDLSGYSRTYTQVELNALGFSTQFEVINSPIEAKIATLRLVEQHTNTLELILSGLDLQQASNNLNISFTYDASNINFENFNLLGNGATSFSVNSTTANSIGTVSISGTAFPTSLNNDQFKITFTTTSEDGELGIKFTKFNVGDITYSMSDYVESYDMNSKTIRGTDNADFLNAGDGSNLVFAGTGDDVINVAGSEYYAPYMSALNISSSFQVGTAERVNLENYIKAENLIKGGDGTDTIQLNDGNMSIFLHDALSRFHPTAQLSTDSIGLESTARIIDIEKIIGSAGDNLIDLTSSDYSLQGNAIEIDGAAGNDIIWGSDADESLKGGMGDDVLFGGAGNDFLTGNSGADTFQFTQTSTNDVVSDFSLTDGDKLQFFNTNDAAFDRESLSISETGDSLSISCGSALITIELINANLQLEDLTAEVLEII